jgi:hypothetical protein
MSLLEKTSGRVARRIASRNVATTVPISDCIDATDRVPRRSIVGQDVTRRVDVDAVLAIPVGAVAADRSATVDAGNVCSYPDSIPSVFRCRIIQNASDGNDVANSGSGGNADALDSITVRYVFGNGHIDKW